MIYFIVPFCVAITLPLVIHLINRSIRKKESKMNENDFIVRVSEAGVVICILGTILFCTLVSLLNFFDALNLLKNIIISPLYIIFILAWLEIVRKKIIIKGDKILFYPMLGRIKKYSFDDIIKIFVISYTNGTIIYKIMGREKKLFSFANTSVGHNLFISSAKKKGIEIIEKNK